MQWPSQPTLAQEESNEGSRRAGLCKNTCASHQPTLCVVRAGYLRWPEA